MADATNVNLDETLHAFRYYITPDLISKAAFVDVKNAVRWLPAPLASEFLLECQLEPDNLHADLSIYLDPNSESARQTLTALVPADDTPPEIRVMWEKIGAFGARWADSNSTFYDALTGVWLEVDILDGGIALPNLLFRIKKDLQEPQIIEQITSEILNLFFDAPLAEQLTERVVMCHSRLPMGCELGWVGAMLGRPSAWLKMTFPSLSAEALISFLESVGWGGSLHDAATFVTRIAALIPNYTLALDSSSEVFLPKIGLECFLEAPRQLYLEPAWRPFLDQLVLDGSCTTQKRDALMKWPGYYHHVLKHLPAVQVLNRVLYHVKITYDGDSLNDSLNDSLYKAKAYLYVGHCPTKTPLAALEKAAQARNSERNSVKENSIS